MSLCAHLAILGGKEFRHLKRHNYGNALDAIFNSKVILNYILIVDLEYLLKISLKTAYLS